MMTEKLIKEMKELNKIAREKGRILTIDEAFELYPVEEEVHKGKLEYWTKGDEQNEVRDR
ncbi:MAG: hypothetical protein FWD48_09100 [Oscillospiraceae bacterium]|nr:hypothetical protein [Oscillospiraceae bacterium]